MIKNKNLKNRTPETVISHKSQYSKYTKDETVVPIKKRSDRDKFKDYWLGSRCRGKQGRRNWTIFRVGIVTALRASDLVKLQKWQVYDSKGNPRTHLISQIDKKTNKKNNFLDIKALRDDLILYRQWLDKRNIGSKWLFPKYTEPRKHITSNYLYQLMSRTGDKLGVKHVGSHSLRKTFGYLAYKQTNNIAYVMKRLNQSSPAVTLRYIGLEGTSMDKITDSLNLN